MKSLNENINEQMIEWSPEFHKDSRNLFYFSLIAALLGHFKIDKESSFLGLKIHEFDQNLFFMILLFFSLYYFLRVMIRISEQWFKLSALGESVQQTIDKLNEDTKYRANLVASYDAHMIEYKKLKYVKNPVFEKLNKELENLSNQVQNWNEDKEGLKVFEHLEQELRRQIKALDDQVKTFYASYEPQTMLRETKRNSRIIRLFNTTKKLSIFRMLFLEALGPLVVFGVAVSALFFKLSEYLYLPLKVSVTQ